MINHKLIKALKKKDETAFEYVYQQTKKGVYAIIFSVVKSHQVTEDLMQDVYMKMMTSINQYQAKTSFNNWLLTIAKNHAIDYYRRSKKEQYINDVDYENKLVSNEISPEENDHFIKMMEILSEEQRTIVLLKIVDNMKFKDIAHLVDKPLGTVIWHYHEALKVLKGYEDIS
jgi:RNA polymerase sigma-70 factor, ECF subfamily